MKRNDTAENLFWDGVKYVVEQTPSPHYTERLLNAAELWRNDRNYFAAALATSTAILSTLRLRLLFLSHLPDWTKQALADYRRCIDDEETNSLVKILALMKSHQELIRYPTYYFDDPLFIARERFSLQTILADKIIDLSRTYQYPSTLLFEGFRIYGSIESGWKLTHVDDFNVYNHYDLNDLYISYRIDSALDFLLSTGDYLIADELFKEHKQAIITPRLKGWNAVVNGMCQPKNASSFFFEAAEWFSSDEPDPMRLARSFDELSYKHSWSTHFKMRGYLAQAAADETNLEQNLGKAVELADAFKLVRIPSVERLDYLVKTLFKILTSEEMPDPEEAKEEFEFNTFTDQEMYDPIIGDVIENFIGGSADLLSSRRRGLAKIGKALQSLERLPILLESDVNALSATMDLKAIKILDGPLKNWMHKVLSDIRDESVLRKILLRLFQNQLPHFAQVRHGPLEYGKDIVVLRSQEGRELLTMYQVKCGDLGKKEWNQQCRPQLEEIFQIPLPEFQLNETVTDRIGILVWNGHFTPFVENVVEAWKKEQLEIFGRSYEFMNIDAIVNYIIDTRLVTALRVAIDEFITVMPDQQQHIP